MGVCRRYPEHQNKHEMDWCGEHQLAQTVSIPVYDVMAQAPDERKKPGRKPKNDQSDSSAT